MKIIKKLKEAMGTFDRINVEKKGAFAPKGGKLKASRHKSRTAKRGTFHKKSGHKK